MPHINVEPEPVEEFLSSVVCVDRMAMYHECIDLFRQMERASVLEDLNHIIFIHDDSSPSEITDLIHQAMVSHLKAILLEFNVSTEGGELNFLIRLTRTINLLDAWDEPEHIINVATYAIGEPRNKLFNIINVIDVFDEEEYYQTVTLVSLSLIERVIKIHTDKLDNLEMDDMARFAEEEVAAVDLSILRKVVKGNRQLVVAQLFEDGVVSNITPTKQLIQVASPYLDEKQLVEPKAFAAEVIGIFLCTGLTGEKLIAEIKTHLPEVSSDDLLISRTNVVLNTVYMELTA